VRRALLFLIAFLISFHCIAQQTNATDIIVSKDGYELTEQQFNLYVDFIEMALDRVLDFEGRKIVKEELKASFLNDPPTISAELNLLARNANFDQVNPNDFQVKSPNQTTTGMAQGHSFIRQKLGSDIGQMQFDTQKANNFRAFIANSLLSSRDNSYDGNLNSSSYSESSSTIQFCIDGSYLETNSGHISIDVDGLGTTGSSTDYVPGYWEVAELPNDLMIIIMYSEHPSVVEDSPNGIIPFIVGSYAEDYVLLPNGDGFRRSRNNCN
jgi:hypothetical protein